ncbi:MAG: hypothetical protein IPP94_10205 [Ignavibacteria bacterium]|nr:hypothetical protein [Ignavibacteria bacterium]
MKSIHTLFLGALLVLSIAGCEKFVQSVDPPIDSIADDKLNTEASVPFLVNGVRGAFSRACSQISLQAGALSDELVFDRRIPGASSQAYDQLDRGLIPLDNEDVEYAMELLGSLRYYADRLVARTGVIAFTDEKIRNSALFAGYLYGGVARYYYATYFGLSQTVGGGVLDGGPFIPSAQMYALALEKLNAALPFAATDAERRAVHTLIARIHLYEGRYAEAAAAAREGLLPGDEALTAEFSDEMRNDWYAQAGAGRTQLAVDPRYMAFLVAEPAEAARLPLTTLVAGDPPFTYYRQEKFATPSASIPFLTWEENTLILAEEAARGNRPQEALDHVNAVRNSHGLDPLLEATLDVIVVEREKELFCSGARLVDQRRFDAWHLPSGTWRFLPITQRERDGNAWVQ